MKTDPETIQELINQLIVSWGLPFGLKNDQGITSQICEVLAKASMEIEVDDVFRGE